MSVVIDPAILEEVENATRWRSFVDPLEPGRRYFSVDFDCVSYSVVARDEAHVMAMMPVIYNMQYGGQPDVPWEEAFAEHGLDIVEIFGTAMIYDDGRDGLRHPLNTYALGTWASSEY